MLHTFDYLYNSMWRDHFCCGTTNDIEKEGDVVYETIITKDSHKAICPYWQGEKFREAPIHAEIGELLILLLYNQRLICLTLP